MQSQAVSTVYAMAGVDSPAGQARRVVEVFRSVIQHHCPVNKVQLARPVHLPVWAEVQREAGAENKECLLC